jgi:hypothetical protein
MVQAEHSVVMEGMLRRIRSLASSDFPVRFAVQSGDAVLRGGNGAQWNVSFTPVIERLTRIGGVPYFLAAGNHDVTGMPWGDPQRELALHNTLTAISRLIPPEGSPRRLAGYPTYGVAFGNLFMIALDSNIAADRIQLAWVTDQLEHLDRSRYRHVVLVFHHPVFSSGPHGGGHIEPPTAAIRELYMPLFRRHRVRLIITGHEHLYEHWIERYTAEGMVYRIDELVTGGGGAPTYVFTGEPDTLAYTSANAAERVQVERAARPGPLLEDNPHHFVVVQVDGDRLSLDVVGAGPQNFAPYNGRSRIDLWDRK